MAIAISTSLIAFYAALQFFKIDPVFLRLYPDNWRGLAFSTMGNPNFLGSYFVLTLPIPIYLYLIRGRWIGLPLYALAYFGLLTTRTRGTWIGAMIGFLVLVALAYRLSTNIRRTMRRIILLSLISILLFAVFILLTDEVMLNKLLRMFTDLQLIISHPEDADTAGSNRFYIWQRTVDLIRQRPIFGVGVENMSLAMYRNFREMITQDFGRYRNWDKAHNEYLNIALASGIPSLIAYLGFTFTAIGIGWKKRRDCPLLLPFLAGAIGYMVQAIFNIQMIIVYYFFMATLGILVSEVFCQKELPIEEIPESLTEMSHD